MEEKSTSYNKEANPLYTTNETNGTDLFSVPDLDPEDALKLESDLLNKVTQNAVDMAKLESDRKGLKKYLQSVQKANINRNMYNNNINQNANGEISMSICSNNSEDDNNADMGLHSPSYFSSDRSKTKINGHMNTSCSLTSPMRQDQIDRYIINKSMCRTPPPNKEMKQEFSNDEGIRNWKSELEKRKANLQVQEKKQQKLRNLDRKISYTSSISTDAFRQKLKEQKEKLKKQSQKLVEVSNSRALSDTNHHQYNSYHRHHHTLTNSTDNELSQRYDEIYLDPDFDQRKLDNPNDYNFDNGIQPVRMIDNPYYLHDQNSTDDKLCPAPLTSPINPQVQEEIQRSASSATYTIPGVHSQQFNVPLVNSNHNFLNAPPTDNYYNANNTTAPINFPSYYAPVPHYPPHYSFPVSTPNYSLPYSPAPSHLPFMHYSLPPQIASPFPMYHSFPFSPTPLSVNPQFWSQPYSYPYFPAPSHQQTQHQNLQEQQKQQQQHQFGQSFPTSNFSQPMNFQNNIYSPFIPTSANNLPADITAQTLFPHPLTRTAAAAAATTTTTTTNNNPSIPCHYLTPSFPDCNTYTGSLLPDKSKVSHSNNTVSENIVSNGNPIHLPPSDIREPEPANILQEAFDFRESEELIDEQNTAPSIPFQSIMPNSSHVSPLYNLIKEKIYSDVVTLISNNETRPYYLIEMLRVLHLLNTDYLRQIALQSVKNIVYNYIHEDFMQNEENSREQSRIESPTQHFPISKHSYESKEPHPSVPAPSLDTSLERCQSRHKNHNSFQQQPADYYSDDCHSVLSELTASDLESNSEFNHPFKQQIKIITTELVHLFKNNLKETCTPKLFTIIHTETFSLLDLYFPANLAHLIQQRIDQDLRHLLLKFSNQPIKDCGEDILVSLAELLIHQTNRLLPASYSETNSSLSLDDSEQQDDNTFLNGECSTTLKNEPINADHKIDDAMSNNSQSGYPELVIIGKHLSAGQLDTDILERPVSRVDAISLTRSESRPIQDNSDMSEKHMTDDNNSFASKTIDTISETQSCTASDYSSNKEHVTNFSRDQQSEDNRTDNTSQDGTESNHSIELPPFANLLQQNSVVKIDPVTDATLLNNNAQIAFTSEDEIENPECDNDDPKVVYSLVNDDCLTIDEDKYITKITMAGIPDEEIKTTDDTLILKPSNETEEIGPTVPLSSSDGSNSSIAEYQPVMV